MATTVSTAVREIKEDGDLKINGTINCGASTSNYTPQEYELLNYPAGYTLASLKNDLQVSRLYQEESCCQAICRSVLRRTASVRNCQCSGPCARNFIESKIPLIGALRKYDVKGSIVSDIIAGITVGVTQVPQGMGYALLAGLHPVFGLYTSLFPTLVYVFLTPSHATSFGTVSLVCLMLRTVLDNACAGTPTCTETPNNHTTEIPELVNSVTEFMTTPAAVELSDSFQLSASEQYKAQLAVLLCAIVAGSQLLMYIFRLAAVCVYFSDMLVSGCMAGSAFLIFISQVPFLLGLKSNSAVGIPVFIRPLIDIARQIRDTNIADLVVSLICVFTLAFYKMYLDFKLKKFLKFPIPIDILVVGLSILITFLADLPGRFALNVVGTVPQGLPRPRLPPVGMFEWSLLGQAIPIAIIGFLMSVLMAKLFASKYGYSIDTNQEMLANGAANLFGCFFSCFPAGVAPPRTMVFDSVQGKSQIAYLFSSGLLILIISALGPIFRYLPIATLASVVVVALIPMFMYIGKLPEIYRMNKLDFMVFVGTFVTVMVLGILFGIVIGVVLSLMSIIIHTQLQKGVVLTPLSTCQGVYLPVSLSVLREDQPSPQPNYIIFKFNSPLFFANSEIFLKKVLKEVHTRLLRQRPEQKAYSRVEVDEDVPPVEATGIGIPGSVMADKVVVIVDFSSIHYVDLSGIKVLHALKDQLNKLEVELLLANCCKDVLRKFEVEGILEDIGANNVFLNLHQAVLYVQHGQIRETVL